METKDKFVIDISLNNNVNCIYAQHITRNLQKITK